MTTAVGSFALEELDIDGDDSTCTLVKIWQPSLRCVLKGNHLENPEGSHATNHMIPSAFAKPV